MKNLIKKKELEFNKDNTDVPTPVDIKKIVAEVESKKPEAGIDVKGGLDTAMKLQSTMQKYRSEG